MTNKLEHYVPESGRALRTLHMERRKTQKNEMTKMQGEGGEEEVEHAESNPTA